MQLSRSMRRASEFASPSLRSYQTCCPSPEEIFKNAVPAVVFLLPGFLGFPLRTAGLPPPVSISEAQAAADEDVLANLTIDVQQRLGGGTCQQQALFSASIFPPSMRLPPFVTADKAAK